MTEDEHAGRGPLAVAIVVLSLPMRGEAAIRTALVTGMRAPAGMGRKLVQGVAWSVAWLAYLPVILLYEAAAVPLVGGSLLSAAVLCAVVMVVASPLLLSLSVIGRIRHRAPTYAGATPAPVPLEG